jgi:Tol biopolymer transport system component
MQATKTNCAPGMSRRQLLAGLGVASGAFAAEPKELRSIWRFAILTPGKKVGPPSKLVYSFQGDWNPWYSPDGKKIVFESLRGETRQNWVSNADGSNAFQLTWLGKTLAGTPRWSPDGRRIVFDASDGEIRIVPSNGGEAVNLTKSSFRETVPTFSRDSQWVYFSSDRSGQTEIWKMPVQAGDAQRVTRRGGHVVRESADGKHIYYIKSRAEGALWRMPVSGGAETQVIDSVVYRAFEPLERGIYFLTRSAGSATKLCYFDLASGGRTDLATLTQKLHNGFSVSSDERHIIYSNVESVEG